MQALILSGGYGTRLSPLTYTRAKSLLPILNKPMIRYLIDKLPKEIKQVIIAANYKSEQLEEYFKGIEPGREIIINKEAKPLGTGGAIKFAEEYIKDTFLVMNSDIICSLNLRSMIEFHRTKKASVTISLWPVREVSQFGVVEILPDQRVTKFVEKPLPAEAPSNLINAGIYVLEPEVLGLIQKGRLVSLEEEIFPKLLALDRPFYGYRFEGYWIDVGRAKSYLDASRLLLSQNKLTYLAGKDSRAKGEISNSTLGSGVRIEEGAKVESSILYDKIKLGKNVIIKESIIGEGCKIKDSNLKNCIVGDGEVIEGKKLRNLRVWSKPIPKGYPEKQIGNVIPRE
jgi:mannose-1-phosphate guanylyltransferase